MDVLEVDYVITRLYPYSHLHSPPSWCSPGGSLLFLDVCHQLCVTAVTPLACLGLLVITEDFPFPRAVYSVYLTGSLQILVIIFTRQSCITLPHCHLKVDNAKAEVLGSTGHNQSRPSFNEKVRVAQRYKLSLKNNPPT